MPRANRFFAPGHIWHITHRCHNGEFLLRHAKDRNNWLNWLLEAKNRHKLCILGYAVTCNHIHLLVFDDGIVSSISKSMHLVSGSTALQYNKRKTRKGAFWKGRFHATAVEDDIHFFRCLVYIELNMVRAGAVEHPSQWKWCSYYDIQNIQGGEKIVDHSRLAALLNLTDTAQLPTIHKFSINEKLGSGKLEREEEWTTGIAFGNQAFVESFKEKLGRRGQYRKINKTNNFYELKEDPLNYSSY